MSTQPYQVDRRRVSRDSQSQSPLPDIDVKELFLALWRSRKIIIGLTLLFGVLAAAWLAFQTPEYAATSVVQINNRQANVLDTQNVEVLGQVAQDNLTVESEVDILQSPYMAGRVVDKLNLMEKPEFNPLLKKGTLFGWFDKDEKEPTEVDQSFARSMVIETLQKKLSIHRAPRSLTITLTAYSEDPQLAADIANTLANEYLGDQLETRFNAANDANQWLNSRLAELRQKLMLSEQEVQKYRKENNLFESPQGLTVNDQQMSELSSQLILARAARAEAEAKLRRARQLVRNGSGLESAAEVLDSPLIQKLREQEAELAQTEADLASRYGPKHPSLIKTRAGLQDLKNKIGQEINKIITNIENDVEVVRTREKSLQSSLKDVQGEVGNTGAAELKLAELTREMDTNRKLYESFLSRAKETDQQKDLAQTDARIVSQAVKPYKPAKPNKKLILLAGLFFGFGLGSAISLLLNFLDNTLRNTTQLERASGYAVLGALPKLPEGTNPLTYFREKPTSHFAENLRKIQSSAHFSSSEKPPQILMVTSSLTGEGKSILTLSMAQAAAKAGLKTIVLDGDMRRPMVAKYLHAKTAHTLADVLAGNVKWQDAITKDNDTGVDYLPSKSNTENSNEILNTEAMDALLADLRKSYDLVLLDTPPVGALVDAMTLARKVDSTIFAVQWGSTSKSIMQDALKPLQMYRLPVAGLVLTQVDVNKDKEYGSYGYYKSYSTYYND